MMENTANKAAGELHPAIGTMATPTRSPPVVGALLAFVANGLHPHPTDFRLEALLQQIADSPSWGTIHLTLICAVVLILGALAAITFSIDGEPGVTVARFACLAALLGCSTARPARNCWGVDPSD
jgi:hypothetical protein